MSLFDSHHRCLKEGKDCPPGLRGAMTPHLVKQLIQKRVMSVQVYMELVVFSMHTLPILTPDLSVDPKETVVSIQKKVIWQKY